MVSPAHFVEVATRPPVARLGPDGAKATNKAENKSKNNAKNNAKDKAKNNANPGANSHRAPSLKWWRELAARDSRWRPQLSSSHIGMTEEAVRVATAALFADLTLLREARRHNKPQQQRPSPNAPAPRLEPRYSNHATPTTRLRRRGCALVSSRLCAARRERWSRS